MPSPLPSSFASAAAGNTHDSRRDGLGSGEWSRSRANGATQTFRRPSVATNQSHNRESPQTTSAAAATPTSGAYIPPHLNSNYQTGSRTATSNEGGRYSKEQLLSLYKSQQDSGELGRTVKDFFMAHWNPHEETPTANGSWGKRDDFKDNHATPEVCWDHSGQLKPLGLTEMNEEEKELFSTSVNSPLKPPPQGASKDGSATGGTIGRKTSISHSQSHMNSFNSSSPGSTRPGPRRRGTGDSVGNMMSPTSGSRFSREEPNTSTPPPSLLRRKTDFRDTSDSKVAEKDKDAPFDITSPYGSLKRSTTNPLSAGAGSPSSPWATTSHSSAFSPMGSFGSFSLPQGGSTEKKPGFGSLRGESRFKNLLSKDSSEDIGSHIKEKSGVSTLERLPENESQSSSPWGDGVKTRTSRSETNPFAEEPRTGSAALGGQDIDEPASGIDQFGLSHLGLTSDAPGFRDLQDPSNHTPGGARNHEPMSPTNTNPYQSPHGERADAEDIDTDGSDIQQAHLPNLSELREETGMGAFGPIRRTGSAADMAAAGDRSQTSSAGANRGFPGLGGLGGLSGAWPTSAAGGTPTRERSSEFPGFGDPIFGPMNDLQSPSLSTLGGGGFFGSHTNPAGNVGTGRTSKMGSLFPQAMQDQMRSEQARQDSPINDGTIRPQAERNVSGSGSFEAQKLDSDAQVGGLLSGLGGLDIGSRVMRNDDSFLSGDIPNPISAPTSVGASQPPASSAIGQAPGSSMASSFDGMSPNSQNVNQAGAPGASNQLPASQQRQMVMPDRMRWIYRDPQGNTQGPWSGLEMHDWFKAGFFTAELQVKKLEDAEYEPLAQLVRRIGNSREPFLVPQIGVPHGPEPPPGAPWGATNTAQGGVVQPPFPSSFPNFGTTLSADQQNALERRKQEEQFLMARQKEHLAQQQVYMKHFQLGGPSHPHPLQHHSSAHSLHSQPSFGSITSPGGYQPSPMQAPIQPPHSVPGFFEPPMRQPGAANMGPQPAPPEFSNQSELPALLGRLDPNRRGQFPFNSGPSFGGVQQDGIHSQQVSTMLQDRARLQQEQEQYDQNNQADSMFDQQARDERLRQFHALRRQTDDETHHTKGLPTHPPTMPPGEEHTQPDERSDAVGQRDQDQIASSNEGQGLSLSQQVQKAASAQRQQQLQQQQQQQARTQSEQVGGPWAKVDNGLPQPFPPPPSASPLPAPAAQRSRQNVADTLAASSRSQNQTPVEAQPTSIAPWAKETSEAPKGPSLKEIQEAEALQAAKMEEVAAAARRAALLEQERANPPPAPAPGLPSTANWASAASPVNNTSSSVSPWNKAFVGNPKSATAAPAKKTLAQIQKEEEARKQRLAAMSSAQNTASNQTASPAGKRYADLAGKVASPTPSTSGGAWTTVGAGGKPKPPPAAPAAPAAPRAVAGNIPASTSPATARQRATPTRPATYPTPTENNPNKPMEELTKWVRTAISKGLNKAINLDEFVHGLQSLPADPEIISDSIYAHSQTLDGRRFAEEYVRRRKLAEKGVSDPVFLNAGSNGFGTSAAADQNGSADGWNEVAKKGSANANKDDSNAEFQVVPPKKKGKR